MLTCRLPLRSVSLQERKETTMSEDLMTGDPAEQSPDSPESEEVVASPTDSMAAVPKLLAKAMRLKGIEELTSIQEAVLDTDCGRRDLRISSQTGSGKTVAIGLALSESILAYASGGRKRGEGPRVLALVPTRELAMQVSNELRWLFGEVSGLRVEAVLGGTSVGNERRLLASGPQIVVGTPGRVLDHLKSGALDSSSTEHVVLDESDRMLDMGFRDELEGILELMPDERRTHLISATFPKQVQKLADRFQRDVLHIEGTRLGDANQDIEHVAHRIQAKECYGALVNLLLLHEGRRCLVFVERRVDVNSLAEKLSSDGFPVQAFSGELPQAQRTRTLNGFRSGTVKTLISTDVAARGIDVPDIDLVIHVDLPGDSDTLVHRSGRTGRAGRSGRSVMLVLPRAERRVTYLYQSAGVNLEWQAAPSASKVRKRLRKGFRKIVRDQLVEIEGLTPKQLTYAQGLLEDHEPAAIVAALLEMAQPKPTREPFELRESALPVAGGADSGNRANPGFVRFTINWGKRHGAAPSRVLGHICRRGQVQSQAVGAIEIGSDESSFDVDERMANRFEQVVRSPDSRDPHLRIVRVGGSAGGEREKRSRKFPRKKFGKKGPPKNRKVHMGKGAKPQGDI